MCIPSPQEIISAPPQQASSTKASRSPVVVCGRKYCNKLIRRVHRLRVNSDKQAKWEQRLLFIRAIVAAINLYGHANVLLFDDYLCYNGATTLLIQDIMKSVNMDRVTIWHVLMLGGAWWEKTTTTVEGWDL